MMELEAVALHDAKLVLSSEQLDSAAGSVA